MIEQSRESSEKGDKPTAIEAPSRTDGSASTHGPASTQPSQSPPGSQADSLEGQKATWRRKALMAAAGALVLLGVLAVGIPWTLDALNTVSTDDAFVNGHVTFVAARVSGQVARVLVDDNNRVRRGDLLVELDKKPYQVAVAVKQAAVDTAKADLQAATATAHGIEAEARSRRWKLQHAIEDVANQIAELHTRVAGVDKSKAALKLAEVRIRAGKSAGSIEQYSTLGVRS
jgi:membrane fusion protein (multidrug efflux system)